MAFSSKLEMEFSVIRMNVRGISVICCYENKCKQNDLRRKNVWWQRKLF